MDYSFNTSWRSISEIANHIGAVFKLFFLFLEETGSKVKEDNIKEIEEQLNKAKEN